MDEARISISVLPDDPNWEGMLTELLRRCRVCLIIVSNEALASAMVRSATARIIERDGCRVVVVALEPCAWARLHTAIPMCPCFELFPQDKANADGILFAIEWRERNPESQVPWPCDEAEAIQQTATDGIAWERVGSSEASGRRSLLRAARRSLVSRYAREACFSASVPLHVRPEDEFVLEIYTYQPQQRMEMVALGCRPRVNVESSKLAGVRLPGKCTISVHVEFPSLLVQDPGAEIEWFGGIANVQFLLSVPKDAKIGHVHGTASISIDGVPRARMVIPLQIEPCGVCDGQEPPAPRKEVQSQPIRSAFASYASEDRASVTIFEQSAALLGVETFMDVLKLRPGEDWMERVRQEIRIRDIFCLFWSKHSCESRWVRRELEVALELKACDAIRPFALNDPRDVPLPVELRDRMHFDSVARIVRDYETMRRAVGV
jgi:hypothetical protein